MNPPQYPEALRAKYEETRSKQRSIEPWMVWGFPVLALSIGVGTAAYHGLGWYMWPFATFGILYMIITQVLYSWAQDDAELALDKFYAAMETYKEEVTAYEEFQERGKVMTEEQNILSYAEEYLG